MNLSKAVKIWRTNYKQIRKLKWLWRFAVTAEIILIIIFIFPLALRTPVPFIKIKSDSMLPVLKTGDFVLLSGLENRPEKLINKIIAYYNPIEGRIIVHRVIDIDDNCLITKGDNAQTIDFFRPCKNQILGKVLKK